jgi:hypothetical protein
MKKVLLVLLGLIVFSGAAFAQSNNDGNNNYRYRGGNNTYNNHPCHGNW